MRHTTFVIPETTKKILMNNPLIKKLFIGDSAIPKKYILKTHE